VRPADEAKLLNKRSSIYLYFKNKKINIDFVDKLPAIALMAALINLILNKKNGRDA